MTFSSFITANVTVGAAPLIATQTQASVSYNGVTFTFDREMPVGFFVGPADGVELTGAPFVVSSQAFEIVSISPASGDLAGDGYIGNGAMKNPNLVNNQQGFDGYFGDGSGGVAAAHTPFVAALNVDPAVNGSIAVPLGEQASIVKTVRRTGVTSPDNEWQPVDRYVTLTVLDAAPAQGAFRPAFAGTTKSIWTRAAVDFTPSNLNYPYSEAMAELIAELPDTIAVFGTGAEKGRRFRLDRALGTTTSNYSADIVDNYAKAIIALNDLSMGTLAQRQYVIDWVMQNAIDLKGLIDGGWNPRDSRGNGAGQGGGMWLILAAASALTKNSAFIDAADSVTFQPLGNGFWVTEADIGAEADGKSGIAAQTFFEEHLGQPFIQPDELGSHAGARYLFLGGKIVAWELMAALSFSQGPVGKPSGEAMILGGGADNATNQRAASKAWLSRWVTWTPTTNSAIGSSGGSVYDELVSQGLLTPWTGKPDQPPIGDADLAYFTVGDGQVTLNDIAGFDYSTETVTDIILRYSQDDVQWVEKPGLTLPHTETGLIKGADHLFGWAHESASGRSPFSGNYPQSQNAAANGDLSRNRLTPTGTDAATAPTFTGGVLPKIHVREFPDWVTPTWEEAPSTLNLSTLESLELAAGNGYLGAAYPAPTWSYQWKRDGADIDPTKLKTLVAADLGTALTCLVTPTNASGSDPTETVAVTVPALPALGAGILFESRFDLEYMLRYEAERLAITTSNAVAVFDYASITSTMSKGSLYGAPSGGTRPTLLHEIGEAQDGVTYRVQAELSNNNNQGSSVGVKFEIQRPNGAALVAENNNSDSTVWTVDEMFTKSGTETISFQIKQDSGNGSASGPRIGYLKVSEV